MDNTLGLAALGEEPLGGFPDAFAAATNDPKAGLAEDQIIVAEIEVFPVPQS